jgi:hypothetical protein
LKNNNIKENKNKELIIVGTVAVIAIILIVYIVSSLSWSTSRTDSAGNAYDVKHNTATQTIALSEGWNIISFNVRPENLDINSVFGTMSPEDGEKIVDDNNGLLAVYSSGKWAGFDRINTKNAYKVKVNKNKLLTVRGKIININTEILLEQGWNLIPYYPRQDIDASIALSSIQHCLVKVQDEAGNSYENWGVYGGWVNNIGTLKPGEGYKVLTNSACVLNYGKIPNKNR